MSFRQPDTGESSAKKEDATAQAFIRSFAGLHTKFFRTKDELTVRAKEHGHGSDIAQKRSIQMEIKPQAMAIPKETAHLKQGKYGPIYPKSPACHGFTIIAKIIPGREDAFYQHAQTIEKAVADLPDCLAALKLHYLRWVLFPINGETYFMYQGIF